MLALNIFQWLISDYRMELRASVDVIAPIPHIVDDTVISSESQTFLKNPIQSNQNVSDINISINISNNRDLINLLKNFQEQINTTKKIIDKLVEVARSSENGETEAKIQQNEDINPVNTNEQLDTENIQESKLTSLPPKPDILKESVDLKPAPKLKTIAKTKKELKDRIFEEISLRRRTAYKGLLYIHSKMEEQ